MAAAKEGHLTLVGRQLSKVVLLLGLCLSLIMGACSASPNLRVYRDPSGAFAFAYPNGMVSVKLSPGKGLAVLLRDLVYETENISLMIAPFDKGETIAELGAQRRWGSWWRRRSLPLRDRVAQPSSWQPRPLSGKGSPTTCLSTKPISDPSFATR